MISATSNGNASVWRKVFDQSEKGDKSYSDWSKIKRAICNMIWNE